MLVIARMVQRRHALLEAGTHPELDERLGEAHDAHGDAHYQRKRDGGSLDQHAPQCVRSAPLPADNHREEQRVELAGQLALVVGEPHRHAVHRHRRRADHPADDQVIEVESHLYRDIDHEEVDAQRGHLAHQRRAEQ